jgi:hypothetical protein
VIDAFNGRVDAILSRVKHNNFGTLEQEVRDAFSLVNLNGEAFRNARVQASYSDARIAELRWAVILQELKLKEREEQRRIQEQIREEEKAKRDYERAMQEAAREEEMLRKAMERARAEAASASAEDRSKFEARLDELNQKLADADLAIVFFSPHTLEMKKMPALDKEEIKAFFGREDLLVFTESKELEDFLKSQNWSQSNLLLMSSGTFGGMDFVKFAQEILNLPVS